MNSCNIVPNIKQNIYIQKQLTPITFSINQIKPTMVRQPDVTVNIIPSVRD